MLVSNALGWGSAAPRGSPQRGGTFARILFVWVWISDCHSCCVRRTGTIISHGQGQELNRKTHHHAAHTTASHPHPAVRSSHRSALYYASAIHTRLRAAVYWRVSRATDRRSKRCWDLSSRTLPRATPPTAPVELPAGAEGGRARLPATMHGINLNGIVAETKLLPSDDGQTLSPTPRDRRDESTRLQLGAVRFRHLKHPDAYDCHARLVRLLHH